MKKRSYLIVIALVGISFLFSENPYSKYGGPTCKTNYMQLNKYMGFTINCDAFAFIGAAIDPSYLTTQNYIRQSRPFYILAGTLTGYSIYYLSYPFHSYIDKYTKKKFSKEYQNIQSQKKSTLYACVYVGYVLLNFFIAFLSLWLFAKIVNYISGSWKNNPLLFIGLCILLLSNQLTQNFIWTPHQQLFNLLTPLLCIYLVLQIVNDKKKPSEILWIVGLTSLLPLFYGNFLLVLPIILIAFFGQAKDKLPLPKIFGWSLLYTTLFFTPLLLWMLFLSLKGISFYSDEVTAHRQFIWLIDAVKNQKTSFIHKVTINTGKLLQTTGALLFPLLFLLTTYLPISKQKKRLLIKPNKITISPF